MPRTLPPLDVPEHMLLRRYIFRPYNKGPSFVLQTWDTGRPANPGRPQWGIGYRLHMRKGRKVAVLFEGEDYGCSPLDAIDSDECARGLLSFLTLRPEDTDPDYFERYTEAQTAFCEDHAEALACEVEYRFGLDE